MNEIISLLSNLDKKQFFNKHKGGNLKSSSPIQTLFKAYQSGTIEDFKASCKSNSFYVYEKRLKEKLLIFLAEKTFLDESTEEISPLKYLISARKLLLNGVKKEGIKTLKKAEKAAKEINHFGLLNEIYQTEIQHSTDLNEVEILLLHKKLVQNNKQFINSEKLNLAYSMAKNSFKNKLKNQSNQQLNKVFDESISYFNLNPNSVLNFKQIYQLAETTNLKSIQQKNFEEAQLFFLNQLELIINTKLDNSDSAPYHVKTLLAIANIRFRRKEFNESLFLLKGVEQQLKKYKKLLIQFEYEFVLLLSLNLNFTGQPKEASFHLDNYLNIYSTDLLKCFNIILVRSMILIQQESPKQALSHMAKLICTDRWVKKNIGLEWLLNKKYIEILLHIELDNLDLVDSLISSLLKNYKPYFLKNENIQIIPFLKLVMEYQRSPLIINSNDFRKKVESTIISKSENDDDIFFICFYAWLKAKLLGEGLYKTTLQLITK